MSLGANPWSMAYSWTNDHQKLESMHWSLSNPAMNWQSLIISFIFFFFSFFFLCHSKDSNSNTNPTPTNPMSYKRGQKITQFTLEGCQQKGNHFIWITKTKPSLSNCWQSIQWNPRWIEKKITLAIILLHLKT